ncbi:aldo/keto reductase [Dyadobacter sediminis]|uniref:Aldo/keto reductase n=1 Tax=Dyadobacter sediminis TaxID=1493691 RepID=A0A5R9KCG0_9BACT|nr:aldo/keto reductase [Dyadobacter sediminis]TLU92397.1 aldo/keto reductase [Dyadobacter sediminis]GGB94776.1 oxidoreductase [Dyadobacter sediminis]
MKRTRLGSQGLEVPVQGLGCMGMTTIAGGNIYGLADEKESIATIHRALELGIDFLDTADLYGPLLNERLVAKAIRGNRDAFTVATKFGFEIDDHEQLTWAINGRPEYVAKSIDRSLRNLGTDYIDLYYLHRVDPQTPIEETVGAMGELVKSGKVKYIGLSEVSAETLRKAHAVHPITAVQTEYSLFEREPEVNGIMDATEELGVGFVAYSPLGRGFLSGQLKSPDDFEENDFRRGIPRFQGENFYKNLELLKEINKIAERKQVTPSQLALAWVMVKGVVSIPGTKRIRYIEENASAGEITFSTEELAALESIVEVGTTAGNRYDAGMMTLVNG